LVASVKSKRFIKFCERFEKFWFEFELKRFDFEKGLKKKNKKKEKKTFLPFSPAAHRPTKAFPAAARVRAFYSFSPAAADTRTPPIGASLSLLPPLSLPLLHQPCAAAILAAPGRLLHLFLSSEQDN
jgi:hypothetical protein